MARGCLDGSLCIGYADTTVKISTSICRFLRGRVGSLRLRLEEAPWGLSLSRGAATDSFGHEWRYALSRFRTRHRSTTLPASDLIPAAYPLIHLGFAYELSSPTLAIEALASAAILYGDQHKYLEDPIYTTSPENSTSSLLEILGRVQGDISFDGLSDVSSLMDRAREISQHHRRTVLEYWNSWSITDVSVQLRDSQRLAVLLLTASTIASSGHVEENTREITFLPALKASRALRILLPLVPARFHIALLRQWWLSVLSIYILHRRPSVDPARISGQMFEHGRLDGDEDWNELKRMASLLYAVEDADRLQGMYNDRAPPPLYKSIVLSTYISSFRPPKKGGVFF